MKKYFSMLKIRFINGLQYRAAAYAGIATQFFWGFMLLLMYKAFYNAESTAFPMEFSQLTSYIWLQQSFIHLLSAWFYDNEITSSITSGNIAYELSRPMDLYNMWFTKNMAVRLSRTILRCLPILLIAALLPKPYGLSLPADALSFIMFLFTAVLGLFTVISFNMLIYIATFYTLSPIGIRIVALSLSEFLTGAIIPLPFLPDGIRQIVELTPFASMENLPLRIYSGNLAGKEMLFGAVLQIFWLSVLLLIGKLWMNKALKRVVIQGG